MSVQQGTQDLVIDLITESKVVLAQLKLNVEKDILGAKSIAKSSQEKVWPMKERSKECPLNPMVRLTFSITGERDLEDPLMNSMLQGKDPETIMLMQQQLGKAEEEVKKGLRYVRDSFSKMQARATLSTTPGIEKDFGGNTYTNDASKRDTPVEET